MGMLLSPTRFYRGDQIEGNNPVPSLCLPFADEPSFTQATTFTRASTGTYVGADGLIATASTNIPRIQYSSAGVCQGLLVEEARTNLVLRSQEFNTTWNSASSTVTVSADSATAPDGTATADALVESSGSAIHRIKQTVTVSASTAYTWSIYVKAVGSRRLLLNGGDMAAKALFSLSGNGSVVATSGAAGNLAATIAPAANGFYRCTLTGTSTGTGIDFYIQLSQSSTSTTADDTYTGDGTSGLVAWGAQLEAGSTASSYIPTTSATVTRSASVATEPLGPWFNKSEGTFIVEYAPNAASDATSRGVVSIGTSAMPIYAASGALKSYDGTTTLSTGTLAAGTVAKAAFGYSGVTASLAVNGATPATGAFTNANWLTATTLYVGDTGSGSAQANGAIRKITYYRRRLPDTMLQALTR